jgi:hypothetical protein
VNEIIFRRTAFERMNQLIRDNPHRVPEFAAALQAMTAELTRDPASAGESRTGRYRIAFFDPLIVSFYPAPAERRVYVVRIRLRRRRRR